MSCFARHEFRAEPGSCPKETKLVARVCYRSEHYEPLSY